MSTAAEFALRAIGAFYVFAGFAGMRALTIDHMMDHMLAAISLRPTPAKENNRRWLIATSALVIGMGGGALMVLNLWAVPLFLIGAAMQVVYLAWARTAFPADDEADRAGRRQTSNAAVIHAVATVIVCLAAAFGLLRPWLDPWAVAIPITELALLAPVGYHFLWRMRHVDRAPPEDDPPRENPPAPQRVRLAPGWGGDMLRNADTGENLNYDDYVPLALGDRLYAWGHAFHAGDDHNIREFWAQFTDADAEAAHRAEGAAIVLALRDIFGAAEGPVYPPDIRYVADGSKGPGT